MTRITVLSGGTSDERAVSLRSGQAVYDALATNRDCEVTLVDYQAFDASLLTDTDVIFPVLHGKGGEDGSLQAKLDALNIPYVGTGATASERCFDKFAYKTFLRNLDVPMTDGAMVDRESFWESSFIAAPFVLKPNDGGSSIDTLLQHDPTVIDRNQVEAIFSRHDTMLLEPLITGIEITVAVLGTSALPVIEIIPPADADFDYENKYNGRTQELCPPQHVSEALQQQAKDLALRIHELCDCRDLSRTDMIINGDAMYVLETNTMPGMTAQSLFPKAALQSGLNMEALTARLVELALSRFATERQ